MPIENKGIVWDDKDIKWDETPAPGYPKGIMEKISAGLHPERYEQMTPEQKKEYLKQGKAEYETSKKEGLKVGLMSLAAEAMGPFAGALKAVPYVGKALPVVSRIAAGTIAGTGADVINKEKVTPSSIGSNAVAMGVGEAIPAVASGVAKGVWKLGKNILGVTTGTGKAAIEEAVKASPDFTKAMRGEMSGEEIVGNAKGALNLLKEQRGAAYQEHLAKLSTEKSIDMSPVLKKTRELMKAYNVKIDAEGNLDLSRVAMGKTGRNDIEDIITTLNTWGKQKGDRTPMGLDALKRQLDDFYSDSSQARQFVSSLRNSVKDTISKAVPEYGEMIKGYSEATKLIKDIESGLMMRKQGMTGRIVADQTLNRLLKVIKSDSDPLRKDLIKILSEKGAQDLTAQLAGYSMKNPLRGGFGGGVALAELGSTVIHPKMWPVLAASSPRLVGEFLRAYGKVAKEIGKPEVQVAAKTLTRGLAIEGVNSYDRQKGETLKEYSRRLYETLTKGDNAEPEK